MAQPDEQTSKRPFFTVITVSFNAEKVIGSTLQSVAEQKGVDGLVEHWVIDGASKDNTMNIVRQFPNVRYISEPDNGITDAFNKGMQHATGDYLIYLNADDIFADDRVLQDIYEFAQANRLPDWIVGHWYVRRTNGDVDLIRPSFPIAGWSLFIALRICHQAVILKREVQESVGGFDTNFKLGMDYDLWKRLHDAGYKVTNFQRPVIVYADGGFSTKHKELADHEHNTVKRQLRNTWWKRIIGTMWDRYKIMQERAEVARRGAS